MNYAAHYARLIERARSRDLIGYCERHHVVPRCMGGGNTPGNIVRLTAEEHYVAHQLLVKIHPAVMGLATAAVRMAKQCTGSRAYGWLRRRHAESTRQKMQGNTFATVLSDAHRAKLVASHLGKKQSAETIAKRSASLRGRVVSAKTRAKIGATNTGKAVGIKRPPRSIQHRQKLREAGLRRTFDPVPDERKVRIAASLRAYWAAKNV